MHPPVIFIQKCHIRCKRTQSFKSSVSSTDHMTYQELNLPFQIFFCSEEWELQYMRTPNREFNAHLKTAKLETTEIQMLYGTDFID